LGFQFGRLSPINGFMVAINLETRMGVLDRQRVTWNFSEPPGYGSEHLPGVFLRWHRGRLLDLAVESLAVGGHEIAAPDLERLNLFIEAGGAWRASSLTYWDAWRVFEDTLRGGRVLPVGPAGGGRWVSGRRFDEAIGRRNRE
jgi:hypothetical protein